MGDKRGTKMAQVSKGGLQLSKVRKVPHQKRARQTVEAILQASAEMFAKLGFAGTTTNKIAMRAGVSIGSLYQYFPNK
jgi:AcrR family transcriptional regulator